MTNNFRKQTAKLWHEIAQIPQDDFFVGNDNKKPENIIEDARTVAPGLIGANYRQGGIVLMAVNPGGGGDAYTRPSIQDAELYPLLRKFRDAGREDEMVSLHSDVQDCWMRMQKQFNIGQKLLPAVLKACNAAFEDVAYLNIFLMRTKNDQAPTLPMYQASWNLAVKRQLDILKPAHIILLGAKTGYAFERMGYSGSAVVHPCLKRRIGDTSLHPEAITVLENIQKSLKK